MKYLFSGILSIIYYVRAELGLKINWTTDQWHSHNQNAQQAKNEHLSGQTRQPLYIFFT